MNREVGGFKSSRAENYFHAVAVISKSRADSSFRPFRPTTRILDGSSKPKPGEVSEVRVAKTTERMDAALWLANGLEAFQDELPPSAASIMLQVQSQLRWLGRGVQTHGLSPVGELPQSNELGRLVLSPLVFSGGERDTPVPFAQAKPPRAVSPLDAVDARSLSSQGLARGSSEQQSLYPYRCRRSPEPH